MAFYFQPFQTIDYDIKKNGKKTTMTNIFLRFKIVEAFKKQQAVYYNYSVKDNERADIIAFKYYEDASLDWIIYLINDIVDPQFDWPLDRRSFENFIIKKYGSLSAAYSETHHYEQILQQQQVLFDGTIIPEKTIQVDLTTYNSLAEADRKLITSYAYEEQLNEDKREIKLLSTDFVFNLLNQVEEAFQ